MKRTILTLLILSVVFISNAQISRYQHPCTIMSQEVLRTTINQPFDVTMESLIIHDVDNNHDTQFKLSILKGDNYTYSKNSVTPNNDFKGILTVYVQINDGVFDSNIYPLKVQVGEVELEDENAIYVATNGDDNNKGTKTSPIATLEKAKELVKSHNAKVVYFRQGDYFMDKSVVFTNSDSGDEDSPIRYMAYPDEKVRFTGSVALPYENFNKATPAQVEDIDNIYVKAKIKVIDLAGMGITNYGEIDHVGYAVKNQPLPAASLVVDGASMHLSRYPNIGNYNDVKVLAHAAKQATRNVQDFDNEGSSDEKTKFKTKSGRPLTWKQTGDIWIDGSMSKAWEWKKNRIVEIAPDSTITMQWEYHSKIGMQEIKMFYFNIFEELDFPEEYFIDREKGLLYVYFPSCVSAKSDIRLTQSKESFIEFDGANYITFSNIIFEGTRNSAIRYRSESSYNTIENCEILSSGLDGIFVKGYGNAIRNCLIHNVGANGVNLTGGEYATLKPAANIVENCKIHDFSQERRVYHPGLTMSGVGQIARHIEIYNGPHMAARISGVNHIVEYCDFHDAPREYSDMLGVYLCTGNDFFSRGTIIRRNKFHDVNGTWKQSAGVYMDNETNGVVVEENYFYNNVAQENGWSVMIHGGGDNIVRGNVFVDCSYPFAISTRLNGYAADLFEGILKKWEAQAQQGMNEYWEKAYPELCCYFTDGGKRPSKTYEFDFKYDSDGVITNYWNMRTPSTNIFENNLVYNSAPSIFVMPSTADKKNFENRGFYSVFSFRVINGKLDECLVHSNNHNVTSDPGFVDYNKHDLRLTSGSSIINDLPHLKSNYYTKIGLKDNNIGAAAQIEVPKTSWTD